MYLAAASHIHGLYFSLELCCEGPWFTSIQEDGCDKRAHQSYLGAERNTPVIPNWFQPCQTDTHKVDKVDKATKNKFLYELIMHKSAIAKPFGTTGSCGMHVLSLLARRAERYGNGSSRLARAPPLPPPLPFVLDGICRVLTFCSTWLLFPKA